MAKHHRCARCGATCRRTNGTKLYCGDTCRLMAKVRAEVGGCWIWTGFLDRDGYGAFRVGDRKLRAHRAAFEMFGGTIPGGLELDHLCGNPACVNPAHLEPVTHAENNRRRSERRTHCANGHELNAANARIRDDGARICRPCQRAAAERYRQRRAAKS